MVNEMYRVRKEKSAFKVTIQMFYVYCLIIYRFNWRLEKMCFVKYYVSEDMSSILESSGGVDTLRNFSAYHEPA